MPPAVTSRQSSEGSGSAGPKDISGSRDGSATNADKPFAGAPGGRRLLTEAVGTFALTGVAAGADVVARVSGGEIGVLERAIAPGLLIMSLIYALGDTSGAHFNPVVSLAFSLKGLFPPAWLMQYWMAQLVGATLAGLALVVVFGPAAEAGANRPHLGNGPAFVVEAFLTWLLVTVVLGTADRHRLVGANVALAVAGTIILSGIVGIPTSGASMNPARSLGPAVATGQLGDLWLYTLAPIIGAAVAVLLVTFVHGDGPRGDPEPVKAASGEAGA
jgi:aquaporin Z